MTILQHRADHIRDAWRMAWSEPAAAAVKVAAARVEPRWTLLVRAGSRAAGAGWPSKRRGRSVSPAGARLRLLMPRRGGNYANSGRFADAGGASGDRIRRSQTATNRHDINDRISVYCACVY